MSRWTDARGGGEVPPQFVNRVLNRAARVGRQTLSYYKDRTREWVSVSGIAAITRERQKIHELYAPDWRAWFPDEGDPRHGTKDDPRWVFIGVDVHAAVFLEMNKPQPVILFEVIRGWVTGTAPDIGEIRHVQS